jgi:hypothetical protein
MGFWSFLNHWWNLPSLVMLGLCAVFVILQAVGLLGTDSEHELDGDLEEDLALEGHDVASPELGSDLDVAPSIDNALDGDLCSAPDGALDNDPDNDLDVPQAITTAEHGAGDFWHELVGFLGVGRVPFMVVWVSLFLCSGFAGIFLNRSLFVLSHGYSGWWFVPVQALALGVGVLGARLAARIAARFVDVGGHGATKKHELTGRLGVVASAVCNDRFGEIRVNDARGNELLVHGRLPAGDAPLSRSASVVLVDFDPDQELFSVAACPELEALPRQSIATRR